MTSECMTELTNAAGLDLCLTGFRKDHARVTYALLCNHVSFKPKINFNTF